jgi:hypothetical protein
LGKYKGIITASLDWFFNGGGSVAKKDEKGNEVYEWGYVYGEKKAEDSNHGSLDVAGLHVLISVETMASRQTR